MAYATQDQVLDYLQGGNNQQGGGNQNPDPTSSAPVGGSTGGAFVSGGSTTQPGQGTGGQKLWTNIQSYLDANQSGQQQRADQVTQTGSGILNTEKNNFAKSTSDAKSAADTSAKPVTDVGQDQASKLLSQATSAERGSDAYNKSINPVKGALTATYAGPTNYSYGQSADTQNFGQAMAGEDTFKNYLSQFDKNLQGGHDLTTGQRGLQNQLDTQNTYLGDARNNLYGQYNQLENDIGSGIKDTNSYVQGVQNNFTSGQSKLRDYLTGQSTTDQGAIDAAVAQHNKSNSLTQQQYDQFQKKFPAIDPNTEFGKRVIDAWKGDAGFSNTDPNSGWQTINQGGMDAAKKQMNDWLSPSNAVTNLSQYQGYDPNIKYYTEASKFNKGTSANAANIYGVDKQRNEFNAIMDMLSNQNVIEKAKQAAQQASFTPGFTTGLLTNNVGVGTTNGGVRTTPINKTVYPGVLTL